eukprot:gnl/MRDRNA2_/MRDRNA2_16760_c0_seq2.p1 gnl/MRDRNA2_/MRDRNA2_16760_c0~~gnl/MRDRNA2_/MRDRNA2_16760_c0_seq2.p1  ORF type:complete len:442 (-),score=61.11 gnl/MRDRNA2_/MRDRNA2_16760_c0_seq2:111-1436(-)
MLPAGYVPSEINQTGSIHDLSYEQIQKLQELRKRLEAKLNHPRFTDVCVLRYLRAKRWDVDAATDMLSKHLDWREQQGMNSTGFSLNLAELNMPETPLIRELYPHAYHGLAKDGTVVYIERLGQLDSTGFFDRVSTDDCVKYFAYQCESQARTILPAASLAEGRLIERVTSILDLDGVTVRAARRCVGGLTAILKLQQEHYPETTQRVVVINAPWIACWVYGLVKHVAGPAVQARVEIIGNGDTKRRDEVLRELIADENLPEFLGGQCACSGGCMHSHKGPWSDPKIISILQTVPYWDILTRIVAGEHMQLMTEYQNGTAHESRSDSCSKDRLLEPSGDSAESWHLSFLEKVSLRKEVLWQDFKRFRESQAMPWIGDLLRREKEMTVVGNSSQGNKIYGEMFAASAVVTATAAVAIWARRPALVRTPWISNMRSRFTKAFP